ncbi:hypothetical protein [Clostridium folliculivorans]|uniref:hypothetical protein n=1 Tax=Clostridium folliculivorans TaxID=2886038 RepID=UPI0021C347E4|nr:hypothetical protein [Clostridium folliculivorans]
MNDKDGTMKKAIVHSQGVSTDYYYLDNNNDFFIGFTTAPNRLVNIPKDKIDFIEIYDAKKMEEYNAFDSSKKHDSLHLKSIDLISNYYDYRIKNKNPEKYISLFTDKYFSSNILSKDLLSKKWSIDDTYNRNNLSDFIGYDISEPQEEKDGTIKIYVMEYWKSYTNNVTFSIQSENNLQKISNLEFSIGSFKLTNRKKI